MQPELNPEVVVYFLQESRNETNRINNTGIVTGVTVGGNLGYRQMKSKTNW